MDKKTYQREMESQIKEWDASIEVIRKKIKDSTEETTRHEQELEALQAKRHAVKSKFDDLREAGEDAWEDIRGGLDNAWDDLKRAGNTLSSFFK